MGYSTDLFGRFDLDKVLTPELGKKIEDFAEERHGGNTEVHDGYPGFWCNWVPTNDYKGIEWNGAEKFYDYVEWLEIIIKKFLEPNGYKLNGSVEWYGEDQSDIGVIRVKDNVVETREGVITFPEPDSKEITDVYDTTRVFWVTDSTEDNEELFESLEDAEEYIEATKFKAKPRIKVCAVKHAYKDNNGEWNYDDLADTFQTLSIWKEYK